MRERFQIPLPMWRVQFQLQGGHRRVWWIVAIVLLLELVAAFTFRRAMQRETLDEVCGMLLYALGVFQVGLLFLAGPNAIHRAMLRDYESKMIESHRMTPMSNIGVALGYLLGPPLLVMLIFLVTMVFGAFVVQLADADLGKWFGGHALILVSAISVWALVVLMGMRQGKPFSPAPVIVGLSAFSVPLAMHPGAGAVLGLYAVALAFAACIDKGNLALEAFVALGFVSLLSSFFWLGLAAVKYRRPDLPVVNAWRGLLLLSLWMILSSIGIAAWDRVVGGLVGPKRDTGLHLIQWISTMTSGMALGCLVVIATANSSILVRQGRMPRGFSDRVHEIPLAFATTLIVVGVLFAATQLGSPFAVEGRAAARGLTALPGGGPWLTSSLAVLSAALTAGALYRLAAARWKVKSPNVLTLVVLLALWALPVVADLIQAQFVSPPDSLRFSVLLATSPGGAIAAAWVPVDVPVYLGLGVQWLVTVLLVGLSRPWSSGRTSTSLPTG